MNAEDAGAAKVWRATLDALADQQLGRRLRTLDSPQGATVRAEGRTLANFSSNDYLGLAAHPALAEAAARAARDHGFGSGASRLVCGSLAPHAGLEERIAAFKGTTAALTFACGYTAALGVIPALAGRGDAVILDKRAHASLVDGARLSGAVLRVFQHNNVAQLRSHLRWARRTLPRGQVLVVTESVFSMDGDRAPLADLVLAKEEHGATLLVDEAHALGVVGPGGRGLAAELGLADRIDVQMGTLGKAVGAAGGYVCGSRTLVELLVNRARSFIFSPAPPAPVVAAAQAGLELLDREEGDRRRNRLWRNIARLTAVVPGAPALPESAIVPWILGREPAALDQAAALETAGFLAPAIRFPSVARGAARIRFTVSAVHTTAQIGALGAVIAKATPQSESVV